MTAIACVKHLGALRPADKVAAERLDRIKHGAVVLVEVKQPRNVQHHRKLWALLTLVYPNTRYPTADALLAALKVYLGHADMIETKAGKLVALPKSISFQAMDQSEFAAFYDSVIAAIVEHFLPGVAEADLRREVESLCGMDTEDSDRARLTAGVRR